MPTRRHHLTLVPAGLIVERHEIEPGRLVVYARSSSPFGICPSCSSASHSVHSHYPRTINDLPAHGRGVLIRVIARRFRCRNQACARRIFAERLPQVVDAARARRSSRLELIAHQVALMLGGRPGERLAERLSISLSADTLIRITRRRAARAVGVPRVVGIDDWAWRRGHRYGTIICDLEKRRIVDLLPNRETETIAAWLRDHPGIEIIARDRGGGYGEAGRRGAPEAIQVADRWHLVENASAALLDAVRRNVRSVRGAIGAGEVDPALLTAAEKRQWDGWQRRRDVNGSVIALAGEGVSLKEIAKRTGLARQTVRRILRGGRDDVFRAREDTLEPWRERLETEWSQGCRNGAELWRRIRAAGFAGGLRVVTEWATRKRRDEGSATARHLKAPSARMIARLMTTDRDARSAEAIHILAAIETAAPALLTARDLVDRFQGMIKTRQPAELDDWIADSRDSELASFANGIAADREAVHAAITERWSNGPVEGQITRLKLIKRQMYGRAKIDLLRARLVTAA